MGIDLGNFDLTEFILHMAVLVLAITIHEFSHAITADRLGDPTPRSQGRVSLLPPDHLDPMGTIMMVVTSITGFGIGWGKPVMVDTRYFKHPARDDALVSVAGPLSNLLQATVFAMIIRFGGPFEGPLATILYAGLWINLSLACFNLIPISPLDGSWIMMALLPRDLSLSYSHWMQRYGTLVFIGVVCLQPRLLGMLIGPTVRYMAGFLLGAPL